MTTAQNTAPTTVVEKAIAKSRVRFGKTRKDRENGAKQTNYENKQARAAWQTDSKTPFPYQACNGKRNRYQVTGKGNKVVYLRDGKNK